MSAIHREAEDGWFLFGLYGLRLGNDDGFSDPLWGDVTLVDPQVIQTSLEREKENSELHPGRIFKAKAFLPWDVLVELFDPPKSYKSEQWYPELPVPHSYIAVRRNLASSYHSSAKRRAEEIAALLGLTARRGGLHGIPMLSTQIPCEISKSLRITESGEIPGISIIGPRDRHTFSNINTPLEIEKSEIRNALESDAPISIHYEDEDGEFTGRWLLDRRQPVVRSLCQAGGTSFDQSIKRIACRMMKALCLPGGRNRIVAAVTVIEALVSSSQVSWEVIKKRAKCVAAWPRLPYSCRWERLEDVFRARNSIVHGRRLTNEPHGELWHAERMPISMLFTVGGFEFESFEQFTKKLGAASKMIEASATEFESWSDEKKEKFRSLLPLKTEEWLGFPLQFRLYDPLPTPNS